MMQEDDEANVRLKALEGPLCDTCNEYWKGGQTHNPQERKSESQMEKDGRYVVRELLPKGGSHPTGSEVAARKGLNLPLYTSSFPGCLINAAALQNIDTPTCLDSTRHINVSTGCQGSQLAGHLFRSVG